MKKIIINKKTFLAILVANQKWKLWGSEDDNLMIVYVVTGHFWGPALTQEKWIQMVSFRGNRTMSFGIPFLIVLFEQSY